MALPGLQFHCRDSGEKRAFACNVANYYVQYVKEMNLAKYFINNNVVTNVQLLTEKTKFVSKAISKNETTTGLKQPVLNEISAIPDELKGVKNQKRCTLSSAFSYFLFRGNRKWKTQRCCKRLREQALCQGDSPDRKTRDRSISLSHCDSSNSCDSINVNNLRNTRSLELTNIEKVPFKIKPSNDTDKENNWLVETHNMESGETTTYYCKYLILANGASDLPNKLQITQNEKEISWLFHDLPTLEKHLDRKNPTMEEVDPVLIVGAGLSAADAVIATRGRNVPVAHVFRSKSTDLNRQLPENMYPEYHKVCSVCLFPTQVLQFQNRNFITIKKLTMTQINKLNNLTLLLYQTIY